MSIRMMTTKIFASWWFTGALPFHPTNRKSPHCLQIGVFSHDFVLLVRRNITVLVCSCILVNTFMLHACPKSDSLFDAISARLDPNTSSCFESCPSSSMNYSGNDCSETKGECFTRLMMPDLDGGQKQPVETHLQWFLGQKNKKIKQKKRLWGWDENCFLNKSGPTPPLWSSGYSNPPLCHLPSLTAPP